MVVVTVITGTANRAYRVAKRYRKKGITVDIGGVHALLMQEEAAKYADVVFIVYAEKTWSIFLKNFKKGKFKKFYKDNYRQQIISPQKKIDKVT